MESIWSKTAILPTFPTLEGRKRCDVLIIGGGMAGILCSHMLSQAGIDHVLVEADRIGSGISKNTTAKITSQHGLIYHKIFKTFGPNKARLYWESNEAALDRYRQLCQTIDCDFQNQDSWVYSMKDAAMLQSEGEVLEQIGAQARFAKDPPLPFLTAGAIGFSNQAQFHPLKFLSAITRDLPIFEHSKVLELSPGKARLHKGEIQAEKIIVATHFPMLNKHGAYFMKLYQHRSYVLALKHAPLPEGMYVDKDENGLSLRSHQDMLLLGGGSHRTGKTGGGWRELKEVAQQVYPQADLVAQWATQDCMSLDGLPYIGQYAPGTPQLFVTTGFNKWGMSSSMVSAMLLTELVQGRSHPWACLYDPSRSMLHPQLVKNAASAVYHLLTPTRPRCPHMGCALKYNKEEHSWDCPCHGSRFEKSGELIDNPATKDKGGLNDA